MNGSKLNLREIIMAMKRQHGDDEQQMNDVDDVQYSVDDLLADLNVAGNVAGNEGPTQCKRTKEEVVQQESFARSIGDRYNEPFCKPAVSLRGDHINIFEGNNFNKITVSHKDLPDLLNQMKALDCYFRRNIEKQVQPIKATTEEIIETTPPVTKPVVKDPRLYDPETNFPLTNVKPIREELLEIICEQICLRVHNKVMEMCTG